MKKEKEEKGQGVKGEVDPCFDFDLCIKCCYYALIKSLAVHLIRYIDDILKIH